MTKRQWDATTVPSDEFLAPTGRVLEMLSEHQCEGWLEGYLLTGRHGLFNCYEAFIHIVDSMFNQHAKWLKVTAHLPWRRKIASLNYLLASHVWRQDHNGFTHQDPGFIDHVVNKKAEVVRGYLPPDANCLVSVMDHCLRSRHYVNTAWSLSGQHTGRTDIPLTEQGEQDARKLAKWLRAVTFSRVFTGLLQRARRTCELAGLGEGEEIEPDLTEWNYGEYEGQLPIDIRNRRPGWNLFRDGCPRGESPAQISDRADGLIARLRTLWGNIAIFSHGSFGRALAARWIGLPVRQAQHFLLRPASLSILGYEHNLPEDSAIVLWNAIPTDIST